VIKSSSPQSGKITVAEILARKRETLELDLVTEGVDLEREALDADISSPGLVLSGYTERFAPGRMQVFGETEMTYLAGLDEARARELVSGLFSFDIPAVFVTKGQEVPAYFKEVAEGAKVPVLRSQKSTRAFYRRMKPFLEDALAPSTNLHGSLADVYGVGLLFIGPSGVGKSECVLDLVERGHRLVADDLVIVSRRGNDLLMGEGHRLQGHHMEIRGLGIVDIKALFGIRAIRQQKRIEVIVKLEYFDADRPYDRTGLDQVDQEILGVQIPCVTVPLNPGKNITVISEVVAMNHLLKFSGVDSSALFNKSLQSAMQPVKDYLEQDYE
jgi:HPr kinase/phosphorylase